MAKTAILSVKILADATKAVQGMEKTGRAAKLMGSAMGAAAGFFAVGKIVDYGKKALAAAADLEQSAGAIQTVFKGSAPEMQKFSAQAATSVGLTKNEFNELGTLIGTQLKNGGTAMDELAPKTNELIGLGADLSSMFGGSSREAVEALSSALKGERDPIERYGVSLSQAKIDAEAAALGFNKVGGALSTEASQAATLSLIMKQTADAHGNFGRESDTLAGQQQRMAATWGNITASVGGLFLPVMMNLYKFINASILPVLAAFVAGLSGEGLGGAMGGLGPIIGTVMTLLNPMSLVWKSLLPVLPLLAGLFQQITGVLTQVFTAVAPLVVQLAGALIPIIAQLATSILPPLIAGFVTVVQAVLPLVTTITGLLVPAIQFLIPLVVSVVQSIVGNVIGLVQGIIQVVTGVVNFVTAIFRGDWASAWRALGDIVSGAVKAVWNFVQLWLIGRLVAGVRSVMTLVTGIFRSGWNLVSNVVRGAINLVRSIVTGGMNSLRTSVSGGINGVISFFRGLPGGIMRALGNLGGLLVNAGRSILDGLLGGLRRGFEGVQNFVGGIAGWIAQNKGPISYDRKLLIPAGRAIMGGLLSGLDGEMSGLRRWVDDAVNTITGVSDVSPTVSLDTQTAARRPGSSGSAPTGTVININVSADATTDRVSIGRAIVNAVAAYDRSRGIPVVVNA